MPEPDVTQSFGAGSWTRSISCLVAGAGQIGLVAQRCLLPKSGAYSCSHHAMRFLVANIRTDAPPWQIIEDAGELLRARRAILETLG